MGITRTTYPPGFCNFNWALSPIAMHKPDYQSCYAGYQIRWLRQAPTSLRENCQWKSLHWEMCPFQLLQQSGDATVIKNFAHEGNSKVVFWHLIPWWISIRASNVRFFFLTVATICDKIVDTLTFSTLCYFSFVFKWTYSPPDTPQKSKQTNKQLNKTNITKKQTNKQTNTECGKCIVNDHD